MALSDRDIIITPNRGASSEPIISLRGADSSSSATMTMRIVNSGTVSTLSFEGTSGQLFSVSDTFAGTIFSANDISGVPSIEVLDSGAVKLAEYNGQVQIGGSSNSDNATSTATGELRVVGGAGVWKDLVVGGSITVGGSINAASISGTVTNSTNVTVTNDPTNASTHYLTMVSGTSGNLPIKVDGTGLVWIPSTNRLGVANTTPSFSLDVGPSANPFQTVARFGNPGSDILITHASAIISHNAYYNGGWIRTGAGYASQVELQNGLFHFQTTPTTAAAGSSITDWTSRLMILNNGDVGIGTSSPAATLHLVRSSNPYTRIQTGGGSYSYLQLDDGSSNGYLIKNVSSGTGNNALPGALYTYTDNSKAFQHIHSGTPLFTILSSGFVGIGNTAPAFKLAVNTAADVWHAQFGTSGGKQVRIGGSTTNGGVIGAYNTDNNSSPASLLLQRDGGNVGIGTAAPSVRLHVVGSSILSDATSIDPDAYTNTVVAGGIADGSGWGVSSAIGGNAGTGDSWAIGHNGNYLYYAVGNGAANNTFATYMVTGGTGRHLWLTPASGGSVGIGIAEGTAPGRKLDVNGVTNISSHITQGTLVSRPNVTWGASGSSTGAVIIKFPGGSANYGMVHIVIDIYTYDGENASTIIIGGHNWNSAWYAYGANRIGAFSKGVRVAFKDGQYAVVLGTNTSTWSYGQVVVRKIQNGSYYSGVMDLGGTYTITQDAAAESYTWISSNLITAGSAGGGGWNSSNDGSGSGLDADLLDGIDSTGFVRSNAGTSGYIELNGGNQNAPQDSTIYATATNNNDWLLRLNAQNSSKTEYGAYVQIPSAATYAWAVYSDSSSWTWRVAGNGANYAPIYYDVSDTSYYVDPNDSSRLNGRLTVAAGHGDSSLRVMLNAAENGAGTGIAALQMWCSEPGNTWDWGGFGFNVDNSQNSNMPVYYFGRPNPNFGQAYMRFGTAGQWYFYTATSGTGDYSGTRYTHMYLAPNNGVETYGRLYNDTRVDAPIFYDSNNTAYYANPASDSRFNTINVGNQGAIAGTTYASSFYHNNRYLIGMRYSGAAANYPWLVHDNTDSVSSFILHFNAVGDRFNFTESGNGYASSSFRAPIFYDSNNTSYYADPASTSRFNVVHANSRIMTGGSGSLNEYVFYCDASATQARRFEIARIGIDYNDWNSVGGFEVELQERYWGQGLIKKYTVHYGYVSNYGVQLTHYSGSGANYFQVTTSAETVVSGDHRYISVFVDVGYYTGVTAIVRTSRNITTSNPPSVGTTFIFSSPTVTNIASFTADSIVTVPTSFRANSLGVGTAPSGTTGEIRATNEITAYYSDRRLKNNVQVIENAVNKVKKLTGITYTGNNIAEEHGYNIDKRQAGVFADEVESVLPEIVRPAPFDIDDNGGSKSGEFYKTVQYEKLVPLLIEAIKEQQTIIDHLSAETQELKELVQKSLGK